MLATKISPYPKFNARLFKIISFLNDLKQFLEMLFGLDWYR